MNNLVNATAQTSNTKPGSMILSTAFIAGGLDILGAILLHSYLLSNAKLIQVLQAIASGVFGREAFRGGWKMAIYGLLFHFIIAIVFTAFFVFIYSYFSAIRKNKVVSGLLFGVFTWCVMNFVVLPLSLFTPSPTRGLQVASGILVLMFFFGLPISLMVSRYYNKRNPRVSEIYALH